MCTTARRSWRRQRSRWPSCGAISPRRSGRTSSGRRWGRRSPHSPGKRPRVIPIPGRKDVRGMTDSERLEAVRRLLHLADAYGLAELEVEEDGLKVTIRGGESAASAG